MITSLPASKYLSASDRARLAIKNLQAAVDELCSLGDSDPAVVRHFTSEIEEADMQLSLLRPRVEMKRSLIHLTSEFGRAP